MRGSSSEYQLLISLFSSLQLYSLRISLPTFSDGCSEASFLIARKCACPPADISSRKILRERTILNVGQDLLHCFLCVFCNDLRSCDIIAVLCCVGDGISHSLETGLIDQVYDQFHLMDTLEICISRIISCLAQCLEASLHQSAYTAAQNCLLAEQVCLSLGAEGCPPERLRVLRRFPVHMPEPDPELFLYNPAQQLPDKEFLFLPHTRFLLYGPAPSEQSS